MERRSYVYKITCKITGEYYFGSSFKAKRDSYWGGGSKIRERVAQYGKENFIKEILGEFDDRVEAHKVENEYIEQFINDDKCLNKRLEHHFGLYGEESRMKNSAAKLGKHHTEETRAKIGVASAISMLGKHFSEEHRANISAAKLGKHHTEETRAKLSIIKRGKKNPMFGKHLSEETKQKIRESLKGSTPWNKGKKLNKETGKYE